MKLVNKVGVGATVIVLGVSIGGGFFDHHASLKQQAYQQQVEQQQAAADSDLTERERGQHKAMADGDAKYADGLHPSELRQAQEDDAAADAEDAIDSDILDALIKH